MKKINNRGFMLTETLIVSTFLVTTLLFLYLQFNKVNKTYETSFKYNTVNGLYAIKNISNYMTTDGIGKLKTAITTNEYIDITSCPTDYFIEQNYCLNLMDTLKIKTIIFTKSDLTSLKDSTNDLDQSLKDFIKYTENAQSDDYYLLAEFKDKTFASLKITK